MDFKQYVARHRRWSQETFGKGEHTIGLLEHIKKECDEVLEAKKVLEHPDNIYKSRENKEKLLYEVIDIIILAIDLAWRLDFTLDEIESALFKKQVKNMIHKWPKITDPNKPTEHIKENENEG